MPKLPLLPSFSLSVTELTQHLRQILESDELLQDIWVMGEISNLSQPGSGHIYFTLKDEKASLHCVIWRSTAARIKSSISNGMSVEVHGAVNIYERSGQYQLYVTTLRLAGEGLLYQEFLRLKTRLEAEGLFDDDRKRALHPFPRKIGIVTSPTGAALQDVLNTLRSRFPLAEVILSPASVQGVSAPGEIVQAIEALNRCVQPDVILLCRGGGSLEDLWAFNDESVVRTVAASRTPVVTGIGHETDFSLADFAADMRAPTPTGCAVLATPDIKDIWTSLAGINNDLNASISLFLNTYHKKTVDLISELLRASPKRRIQNDRQRVDDMDLRSNRAMKNILQYRTVRLKSLKDRLETLAPDAVLQRGYAIVTGMTGQILKSVQDTYCGDHIKINFHDGNIRSIVEEINSSQ